MGLFDEKYLDNQRKQKMDEAIADGMDIREAEMAFDSFDKLPQPICKGVNPEPLQVKFYFRTEAEMELVRKYFRVLDYVEANTRYTEILIRFLIALETGQIKEDELPCLKKSETQL